MWTAALTPSALTRWAALSIPLAAIWRTYEPGTKHDECVVLIGPQGCGKSTAFRKLLPGETMDQRDWFNDALELATDNKRRAEALLGRVIVEASELAGSTRADVEGLKAFLSRTDDGGVRRAPVAHLGSVMPAVAFSFAGSDEPPLGRKARDRWRN